ncbi:MAG: 50S ribosomal protein L15 [Deltaproteobacteria bacterium RBG_13_65_10]|jgi:large subunit ribosomal protein L15|nr:MAG: 50S ribosomal protein L15 [Deltaproteobacteria bacterium RBG_13_65_10]
MAGILSELRPVPGAAKKRKRIGRGPGSGHGKTATKGHKGGKARSGAGGLNAGFEGGQMPLQRRLPKRGFTNIFKKIFQVVNLRDLASFDAGSVVDAQALAQAGLVASADRPVKILGHGEIKSAVTIRASAFSGSAKMKIETAGGTAEQV